MTEAPRMLVVVAHPDDETFGCGSLLLAAADAGMATAVVCATRGEAGDSTNATNVSEPLSAADLGAVREAETRTAADLLGVERVDFLGFADSGMSGDTDTNSLVGAALNDVRDAVRQHIDTWRPSIVVTLDASDGHRDHERIREATLAAVHQAGHRVGHVYLHCLPQALMERWVDHMAATDPSWEHLRGNAPGTAEDLITTRLDTGAYLARREAAMRVHASQRSPFDGLPEPLRRAFLTTESLRRVVPQWAGGPVETVLPASS